MYTVIGKLGNVTGAAEWVADAVPSGTCLGDVAFSVALMTMPDGIVIWHDGAYYVTDGQRLKLAAEGLRVKTITNGKAHALTINEWVDAVMEMRGITKTWTRRYSK